MIGQARASLTSGGGTLLTLLGAAVCCAAVTQAAAAAAQPARAVIANPPASTDPYTASLRYAKCLRRHGVPHPDPDRTGEFDLTPAQEQRLRRVARKTRIAAENACFRHLKGLNLRPLSPKAIARAKTVLADLRECLQARGFDAGLPVVENLSRGRARFGLQSLPRQNQTYWRSPTGRRHQRRSLRCEKEVHMADRITKIINEDRRIGDL